MSSSFLARLPLAATAMDRDYLSRDSDESVELVLGDPATRFIVLRDGRALLSNSATLARLAVAPPNDLLVYLGRTLAEAAPLFAVVVAEGVEIEGEWGELRSLGATLSLEDASIFVEALAITNWHAVTAFSPLSGSPTSSSKGGWVLLDSVTGQELFPRTDMAVIVGVVDGNDRLLLGSNAQWEANRYSLLAGFVEPGESLEAAVVREVFEESGMRVIAPRYLGSQPWPFPASLMLGFMAHVDESVESVLAPDGLEILDLRWFSRSELHAALGEIRLPGSASIARAIIEEWYGGPLEEPAP
jgi:NAD+ diphosphatase